ncbi:hypothetical protein CAPTEDRAFT_125916, partial [Capitella teleta]
PNSSATPLPCLPGLKLDLKLHSTPHEMMVTHTGDGHTAFRSHAHSIATIQGH